MSAAHLDTSIHRDKTGGVHSNLWPSWRMSETSTRAVLFGLYTREALGVRKLTLPPLTPGIPTVEVLADRGALDTQWGRWWASVVEPELAPARGPLGLLPGMTHTVALPLTGAEVLYDALEGIAEPARRWADNAIDLYQRTAQHGGLEVSTLVNGLAEQLGRPVRPFTLNVELIPTQMPGIWWIGQHTIAVTASLRRDPEAYIAALRPIVASVA